MKLSATVNVDPAVWDTTVTALGGTVGHSAAYTRYMCDAEPNAVPAFLTLPGPEGAPAGAAVAFTARSPRPVLSALGVRTWLAALPALGPDSAERLPAFLTALEEYAREAGAVVLEVHSSGTPGGGNALRSLHYHLNEQWEFVLDLRRPEDELWATMESKRRAKVNKAGREGVAIVELPPAEGLRLLRAMQAHSSQRIVARGGPDITAKHGRSVDPAAQLLQPGLGRIVGAKVDGQVVSAGLFTCFGGQVYHTLSGHTEAALRSQAPTLLLWETIKWYKNAGAERFNFGGCSRDAEREGHPEHGVYVYKLGFGGERLECTSGRKILRPVRYAARQVIRMATGR